MEENSNPVAPGDPSSMDLKAETEKDIVLDNNNVIADIPDNNAETLTDVNTSGIDHSVTSAQAPPPLPTTQPPMDEENNSIDQVALDTKPENNEPSVAMDIPAEGDIDKDVLALIEENKKAWSNLEEEFISKEPDNVNSSNPESGETRLDNVNPGLVEAKVGLVDVNMNQGAVEVSPTKHNTDHSGVNMQEIEGQVVPHETLAADGKDIADVNAELPKDVDESIEEPPAIANQVEAIQDDLQEASGSPGQVATATVLEVHIPDEPEDINVADNVTDLNIAHDMLPGEIKGAVDTSPVQDTTPIRVQDITPAEINEQSIIDVANTQPSEKELSVAVGSGNAVSLESSPGPIESTTDFVTVSGIDTQVSHTDPNIEKPKSPSVPTELNGSIDIGPVQPVHISTTESSPQVAPDVSRSPPDVEKSDSILRKKGPKVAKKPIRPLPPGKTSVRVSAGGTPIETSARVSTGGTPIEDDQQLAPPARPLSEWHGELLPAYKDDLVEWLSKYYGKASYKCHYHFFFFFPTSSFK